MSFLEDIGYNVKCHCSILKKADEKYKYDTEGFGSNNPDYLFLFEMPESESRLQVFFDFLNNLGFTMKNSYFANCLCCRPSGFEVNDSVATFNHCFQLHALKHIEKVKPKIIFTIGRSLYAFTNDTFVPKTPKEKLLDEFTNTIHNNSKLSYIYSYKVRTFIFPLPALIDFIGHRVNSSWDADSGEFVKQKSARTIVFNKFETEFVKEQLEKGMLFNKRGIFYEQTRIRKAIVKEEEIETVINSLIENPVEFLMVDTETSGIDKKHAVTPELARLITIQVSLDKKEGYLFKYDKKYNHLFTRLFKSKKNIIHNAKFDLAVLRINGMEIDCFLDTMIAFHYCVDSNLTAKLKALAYRYSPYGGYEDSLEEWKKENKCTDYGQIPFEMLAEYAIMDVIVLGWVFDAIYPLVMRDPKMRELCLNIAMPFTETTLMMERNTFIFNKEANRELNAKYQPVLEEYKTLLIEDFKEKIPEFKDIDSDEKLGFALKQLGLPESPEGAGKKGQYKVGEDALLFWKNQGYKVAEHIEKYKEIRNLLNTFIGQEENHNGIWKSVVNGRITSSYLLAHVKSGRISCIDLNLQQIPKHSKYSYDIRRQFSVPDGWKLVELDFSGFQMRIMAILSGDENLTKLFQSPNDDAHMMTGLGIALLSRTIRHMEFEEAIAIYKSEDEDDPEYGILKGFRQLAKATNFGYLFGLAALSFAKDEKNFNMKDLLLMDKDQLWSEYKTYMNEDIKKVVAHKQDITVWDVRVAMATAFRRSFFTSYPGIMAYINSQKKVAIEQGFVETYKGMRRYLTPVRGKDKRQDDDSGAMAALLNISVNSPVQGFEGHVLFQTANEICKFMKENKTKSYLAGTVHDSLIIASPPEEVHYKDVYKGIAEIVRPEYNGIPIKADVGVSNVWGFKDK